RTGKVVWTDNSPGKGIMEGQWSNPVYAAPGGKPQVIFPAGDGWLYAFDAVKPGKPIWKFNCNTRNAKFNPKVKRNWDRLSFLGAAVWATDRLSVAMGWNPEHGPGVGRLWCVDVTKTGDVSAKDDSLDPKAPANKDSALVWQFGGKVAAPAARDRDYNF